MGRRRGGGRRETGQADFQSQTPPSVPSPGLIWAAGLHGDMFFASKLLSAASDEWLKLSHAGYCRLRPPPPSLQTVQAQRVQGGGGVGGRCCLGAARVCVLVAVAECDDGVQAATKWFRWKDWSAAETWRLPTAVVQLILQAVVGRVGQRVHPGV